jgi:hypothetical protein
VIPPRGKASFKLIFLPLEEGNIENTLFINTSAHGVLSYQVSGEHTHALLLVPFLLGAGRVEYCGIVLLS